MLMIVEGVLGNPDDTILRNELPNSIRFHLCRDIDDACIITKDLKKN